MIFVFLCLTYFTYYNNLWVYPCCYKLLHYFYVWLSNIPLNIYIYITYTYMYEYMNIHIYVTYTYMYEYMNIYIYYTLSERRLLYLVQNSNVAGAHVTYFPIFQLCRINWYIVRSIFRGVCKTDQVTSEEPW